jgi:hypothetical protein
MSQGDENDDCTTAPDELDPVDNAIKVADGL